jgi:hypothetical protein
MSQNIMTEIQQLKDELEKQKKLTKEVELCYVESVKLGMKLVNMTDKVQLKDELDKQKKLTKEVELIAEEAFNLCIKLLNINTLRKN